MTTRSTPERLDEAVDHVLAGERPVVEAELRPLLDVAVRVADALRPLPAGRRFEAELAHRLSGDPARWRVPREIVTPGRLIAAGALSSAAVGVTVTAYAVWRSSRRQPGLGQRLLHR
jgi:hypothetical protein